MNKKNYNPSRTEKRLKKASKLAHGSEDEVLCKDVNSLLKFSDGNQEDVKEPLTSTDLPERFSELKVKIQQLSSTGDGLGFSNDTNHAFVVPFTVPGDEVLAKVISHFPQARYSTADFMKVLNPGPERRDDLVQCRYFAKCAGCQLQMLPYDIQLRHKKTIVEKAFRNFSGLTQEIIPPTKETIGSPMQYGYRTKLTPHFDGPPGSMSRRARKDPSSRKELTEVPAIGFQEKGRGKTLDIEDCPIGTDIVREGMEVERKRVAESFSTFTKGATLLLRENTIRKPSNPDVESSTHDALKPTANDGIPEPQIRSKASSSGPVDAYIETKTCVTDPKATAVEYIDDFIFTNTAGAFFQNNNSILSTFTAYIRSHIIAAPAISPPSPSASPTPTPTPSPIKYLIDAYCGSGLFTITLSSLFKSSLGIDIAGASVTAARENALANGIANAKFMTADAAKLFEEVTFPPDETAVVIDPPRKGCDEGFLKQLLRFAPRRVVYVSCNVHTQARDVGVLVEGLGEYRYEIESLQGFDFFPQTGHVEGVAVLSRSKREEKEGA